MTESKGGNGGAAATEPILDRSGMEVCLKYTVEQGKELTLLVTGYSMGPLLRHGRDRVALVSPKGRRIRRLDIVLFRRPDGKYVLHRILKCLPGNTYLMNGDAQLWTEEIEREQIQAVAARIQRKNIEINCCGRLYRCFSWIWAALFPFRGQGIAVYRWIGGVFCRRRDK